MEYTHVGDIEGGDRESARLAQAGVVNDHALAQENLLAPPSNDSFTPLLGTSIPNGNNGDPSQQGATNSSEEGPPPHPIRNSLILILLLFAPLVTIFASFVALAFSNTDPLGFSFLAFLQLFSLVPCGIAMAFLIWIVPKAKLKLYHILGLPTDDPKRDISGHLVFSYSCLAIYWIFYGTAWTWASARAIADLIDKHGVWNDFQAEVDVPDALALLTRCLKDSVSDRYATIADFSFCLKEIGVEVG